MPQVRISEEIFEYISLDEYDEILESDETFDFDFDY